MLKRGVRDELWMAIRQIISIIEPPTASKGVFTLREDVKEGIISFIK